MLEQAQDSEEIIERVAALDIGKAELMCCGPKRMADVDLARRRSCPTSGRPVRHLVDLA
jgi:hypothetical protein